MTPFSQKIMDLVLRKRLGRVPNPVYPLVRLAIRVRDIQDVLSRVQVAIGQIEERLDRENRSGVFDTHEYQVSV